MQRICSECNSSWWSGRAGASFVLNTLSFSSDASMPFSQRSQFCQHTRARPRCENWSVRSKRTHSLRIFFVLVINSLCRNSSSSSSMRKLQRKQSDAHIYAALFHCELRQATPKPMSDKNNKNESGQIRRELMWLQNTEVVPQMARLRVFLEPESQTRLGRKEGYIR